MKKFTKKDMKKLTSTPLFKKLLIAGAFTAAAAAAFTAVKVIQKKQKYLPGSEHKNLNRAKNIYISGGSVSALAAAVYLIKDGGYDGKSIHIYGASSQGAAAEEYGSIGTCLRALMKDIDAHTDDDFSVDTMLDNISYAAAPDVRIIEGDGMARTLSLKPGRGVLKALSKAFKKLSSSSAKELDNISTAEYFKDIPELFDSDIFTFIEMTFGIRPEHKVTEFLARVEQLASYAPKAGLYDTQYYDFSVTELLEEYLEENGAEILRAAQITGIDASDNKVSALHIMNDGTRMTIYLNKEDLVIIGAGNISDNYSEGSFSSSAPVITDLSRSEMLWADASSKDDSFGLPQVLLENTADYVEFSIVDDNGYLLRKICAAAGCGSENGLSALLPETNWKMKITSEPYSLTGEYSSENIDEAVNGAVGTTADTDEADITPEDINAAENIAADTAINSEPQPVITVKGVYTGTEGSFADKTMRECTGVELLYELCRALGFGSEWDEILEHIKVVMISCYPYKNAPLFIAPEHALPDICPCDNCAVIGAFTKTGAPCASLEQEIESAKKAAYALMGRKEKRVKSKGFDLKKL